MQSRSSGTAVLGCERQKVRVPLRVVPFTLPFRDPAAHFLREISRPANHLRCIERLATLSARQLDALERANEGEPEESADGEADALEMRALFMNARSSARGLARELAAGEWQPKPARLLLATLDKPRLLHRFDPLDLIVHGAVTAALEQLVLARLSPRVHSFQRGRSTLLAQREFAAWLREHARTNPDPRTRGLYILRRDVRAFGDSVPLGKSAPIWTQLEQLLGGQRENPHVAKALAIIEQVVRPTVVVEGGGACMRLRGLPTGSPINPVMVNLNLMPIDARLADIPGGFYSRYGDDFLFAHPDAGAAREASRCLDAELALLGLHAHEKKRRDLWLNGSGRPSPVSDFTSVRETTFLGKAISISGNVRVPVEKLQELFAELERRLRHTIRLARAGSRMSEEDELKLLCSIAADGLTPHSPIVLPHAADLRAEIDDRGQLRDVELRVVRLIVQIARGTSSARALRDIPPSRLRALGLPGLVSPRSAPRSAPR